jgi:alcohol dehydrogenase
MTPIDFSSSTQLVFGAGTFKRLGELAQALSFQRTLLIADEGLVQVGYVAQAAKLLNDAGIEVFEFHDFGENPDSRMVEAGRDFAAQLKIDSLIGLGGGSSLDCAKGINFLLTNGGAMKDYWGYAKAASQMLPMIGVPTTAGTGSEAQSYTLVTDAETRVKMACGDPKAAFKIALLDPALTVTQPKEVTAATGFDAIAHAVETFVTTKRNALSMMYAREAWRLLEANLERVMVQPENIEARSAMQLGAYFAGVAIENSMLGATHACANPLTRMFGTTHGVAIAKLLPHVVRWNSQVVGPLYAELIHATRINSNKNDAGESLSKRLTELVHACGFGSGLKQIDVTNEEIQALSEDAVTQWTGNFNPRKLDLSGAREIYEWAL